MTDRWVRSSLCCYFFFNVLSGGHLESLSVSLPLSLSLPHAPMSTLCVLTVFLIPPDGVQVHPTVVEEELVVRVAGPALQQRHQIPAINHSSERRENADSIS